MDCKNFDVRGDLSKPPCEHSVGPDGPQTWAALAERWRVRRQVFAAVDGTPNGPAAPNEGNGEALNQAKTEDDPQKQQNENAQDKLDGSHGDSGGEKDKNIHEEHLTGSASDLQSEAPWPAMRGRSAQPTVATRKVPTGHSPATTPANGRAESGRRRSLSKGTKHWVPVEGVDSSNELRVDQSVVGAVIGKSGQFLRKVQDLCQVRVTVDQSTKAQGYSTIHISRGTGTTKAWQMMQDMITQMTDPDVMTMRIEQSVLGLLIGPGGQTIKRLQEQSGAHLQADQSTSHRGFSTLQIKGSATAIALAKSLVEKAVGSDSDYKVTMKIDQHIVGVVIGPGGETISWMKNESGATLQFDQSTSKQGFSTLHISGPQENVERAKALVLECEREARASRGGDSAGAESQDVPDRAHPGSDVDGSRGRIVEASMRVEQHVVGLVIGKNGETISNIIKESGAELHFDQSTGARGFSTLYIRGPPWTINRAKALVANAMAESSTERDDHPSNGVAKRSVRGTSRSASRTPSRRDKFDVDLTLEPAHVEFVIGSEQRHIDEIRKKTRAEVVIVHGLHGYRTIRIKSGGGALEAQQLILSRIEEARAFAAYTKAASSEASDSSDEYAWLEDTPVMLPDDPRCADQQSTNLHLAAPSCHTGTTTTDGEAMDSKSSAIARSTASRRQAPGYEIQDACFSSSGARKSREVPSDGTSVAIDVLGDRAHASAGYDGPGVEREKTSNKRQPNVQSCGISMKDAAGMTSTSVALAALTDNLAQGEHTHIDTEALMSQDAPLTSQLSSTAPSAPSGASDTHIKFAHQADPDVSRKVEVAASPRQAQPRHSLGNGGMEDEAVALGAEGPACNGGMEFQGETVLQRFRRLVPPPPGFGFLGDTGAADQPRHESWPQNATTLEKLGRTTSSGRSCSVGGGSTVCHFYLEGWCKHGNDCRYKHLEKADPAYTPCSFGFECSLGHGWAGRSATAAEAWAMAPVAARPRVRARSRSPKGAGRGHAHWQWRGSWWDDAPWKGSSWDDNGWKGSEWRTASRDASRGRWASPACAREASGSAWRQVCSSASNTMPSRMERAALAAISGRWHYFEEATGILTCYTVVADKDSAGQPSWQQLWCQAWSGDQPVGPRAGLCAKAGDIVLALEDTFYLEAFSDKHIVWAKSTDPAFLAKWSREWPTTNWMGGASWPDASAAMCPSMFT